MRRYPPNNLTTLHGVISTLCTYVDRIAEAIGSPRRTNLEEGDSYSAAADIALGVERTAELLSARAHEAEDALAARKRIAGLVAEKVNALLKLVGGGSCAGGGNLLGPIEYITRRVRVLVANERSAVAARDRMTRIVRRHYTGNIGGRSITFASYEDYQEALTVFQTPKAPLPTVEIDGTYVECVTYGAAKFIGDQFRKLRDRVKELEMRPSTRFRAVVDRASVDFASRADADYVLGAFARVCQERAAAQDEANRAKKHLDELNSYRRWCNVPSPGTGEATPILIASPTGQELLEDIMAKWTETTSRPPSVVTATSQPPARITVYDREPCSLDVYMDSTGRWYVTSESNSSGRWVYLPQGFDVASDGNAITVQFVGRDGHSRTVTLVSDAEYFGNGRVLHLKNAL